MLEGVRIIAGTYRSRVLAAPAGQATRPTSDRLRETLFNVLAPRIEGARFLDLYAGSGAVGLEALSRGASAVTFVEREAKALAVLGGNLKRLDIRSGFRVEARGVQAFLRGGQAESYDLVYLDPPWDEAAEYEATLGLLGGGDFEPRSPNARDRGHPLLKHPNFNQDAVVIAEHRRKFLLKDRYGRLERTRLLEQGDAALSFYKVGESAGLDQVATTDGEQA